MCHPRHFDVLYDINPWMSNQKNNVNNQKATEQWSRLVNALQNVSDVYFTNSIENLPDLVFTANAGFVSHKMAILSKFSKIERQSEEKYFQKWFENNGYKIVQPKYSYEGEGDHLVDSLGRHWVGFGFRTDIRAVDQLNDFLNTKVFPLELVDPRWYHLDTAFCPLPNGELLWYPSAFSLTSQQLISKSFQCTVEIDIDDALLFSCNCIPLGNNLFLPKNISVSNDLRNLGYTVHEFDLSEFIKAGGAAKCLVLIIRETL